MIYRALVPVCSVALVLASAELPRGAQSGADDQIPAIVEALPPEIATVRTAGWWSKAERSGTFRIVIVHRGFDKIVSRLYLQWLEVDEAGARVVATRGFDQLNEVPVYQLEISAIRTSDNGIEVELQGASLYTGEEPTFLLRAGAPGTAALTEQR